MKYASEKWRQLNSWLNNRGWYFFAGKNEGASFNDLNVNDPNNLNNPANPANPMNPINPMNRSRTNRQSDR